MAALAHQMTIPLAPAPCYSREDFLQSEANAQALRWIDGWPQAWPAYGAVLQGPAGSGKTHLLHIWSARAEARVLDAAEVMAVAPTALVEQGARIALDTLSDYAGDAACERQLFHLLNAVKEAQGAVLLASCTPVPQLPIQLPDLSSRLKMLPSVVIDAPDDALLSALFIKLLHDRQIRVGERVVHYVLTRIERSFTAVQSCVEALDHAALTRRQPITVALARDVLAEGG